ncbi:hypothetical protein [Pedobacter agri]|uniref:hypothetical protein n=1 Tax=Pedobacter agri TaxID=454586 RepID=UPI002788198E|nr:hypothetical protein [Pedobacter agri]MDQ1139953.1 hypothetical protein [Pedobacter agri]
MPSNLNRRNALKNIIAGTAAIGVSSGLATFAMDQSNKKNTASLKGNVNHSVCRWCFNTLDVETLCTEAKKIGIKGIDLVGPKDWPILKKHGLESTMCNGAEINLVDGFNDEKFHETLIKNYSEMIPLVAAAGYKKPDLL